MRQTDHAADRFAALHRHIDAAAGEGRGQITGVYVQEAIPPYCPERRTPATLLKRLPGGRVLLRDDTWAGEGEYQIETDERSFIPN